MRVLALKVRHVLGLKELDLNMDGNHLILVGGPNGQGKSSTLNALKMALCGKRGMDWPEKALHDGEDEGEVIVELSGDPSLGEYDKLKVHLELKKRRSGEIDKITIYDSTGEPAPNPRKLLSDLYHNRAFDPLAFERMKPTEQRDCIAKLVGIDLDADRAEYAAKFEERTVVNRDVKRLEASYKSLPTHDDAPEAPIVTSDLVNELDEVRKFNDSVDKKMSKVEKLANKVQEGIARITKCEEALEAAKATFKEATEKHEAEKAEYLKLPDPKDEKPILEKISNASELNKKFSDNEAKFKAKQEYEQAACSSNALTNELDRIKKDVEETLASAEFPVPGMTLDREGVLLNGRAFSDNSKKERTIASAKVAIALEPTLRLMVCEDGSDLDEEALDGLAEILKDDDFQALIELVTRGKDDEDRCAVVLEAGAVRGKASTLSPEDAELAS